MPRSIDYWFSLASPWAFLGHQPFLDLAKAHEVAVHYRPVDLGEVFPHTGGLPLPKRHPARQRYRILELQRWWFPAVSWAADVVPLTAFSPVAI